MTGDGAFGRREGNFVVYQVIVEAGGGGIFARAGVIEDIGAGPVDGAETHGAWFAAGVEFAAGKLKRAELLTGGADGDDFGVSGRVVCGGDEIYARCD